MRIAVLPRVLRPPPDCWLLAATMAEQGLARNAAVLDMFTGSGALAVAAAKQGAQAVTAVDVSRLAVLNVRLNARLNRVRIDARRGDMFDAVADTRFDLIVANPPYVPSETHDLPQRGLARAWEAGPEGRAFLDRLCARAADHLLPGGNVLLVQSTLSGERQTLDGLAAGGLEPRVLARKRGPLGPIVSGRAKAFEERGLLLRGERSEELVVIRGSKPHPDLES